MRTSRKPLQRNRKSSKPCERDERIYEQGTDGSKGTRQLERTRSPTVQTAPENWEERGKTAAQRRREIERKERAARTTLKETRVFEKRD